MKRVAIKYRGDGENETYVVVHACPAGVGDSDTLCMDTANDDHYSVGALGFVDVSDRNPIDCPACYDIWQAAKLYKSKDFRPKGK